MEGIKHSSIKCYLSAARHLQITAGLADPFAGAQWPRLAYVLKGIKRDQSKSSQTRPRLPITPEILEKIQATWLSQSPLPFDKLMLWAAFTLGYFGFLRAGEFTIPSDTAFDPDTHLSFSDIAVDSRQSPSVVRVRIKCSKTDPFRQGVNIFLGKTDRQLCPVSAMVSFLAARGSGQGPLLHFQDGRPLTRQRLVSALREALSQANIQEDESSFSGHSFRIGAATAAARRGLEDSMIKMLGRWESDAYHRYIRTPRSQLAKVSSTLAAPAAIQDRSILPKHPKDKHKHSR